MNPGRPRKLDESKKAEVLSWHAQGSQRIKEKSAELCVSVSTLRRYAKRWTQETPNAPV